MGRNTWGRAIRIVGALFVAVAMLPWLTGTANAAGEQQISAKALTDHGCNSSEWHFVITQVSAPNAAPASIAVSWADGGSATVPLDKVTGGTAHYATTAHLDSMVTQATATIYSGWSGEFNLSHGPCGQTPSETGGGMPAGTLEGDCSDSSHFYVSGTFTADVTSDVSWRLSVDDGTVIALSSTPFSERVSSVSGSVVTLEYRVGDGSWTSTGQTITVGECKALGTFTVSCTQAGPQVDLGRLYRGTNNGGRFELVVNGTAQRVTSQQQDIAVPLGATLVLRYVSSDGVVTILDEGTAPTTCITTTATTPPATTTPATTTKTTPPTTTHPATTTTSPAAVAGTTTSAPASTTTASTSVEATKNGSTSSAPGETDGTAVLGTKAGTLPRTGPDHRTGTLLVVSIGLLLAGAAMLMMSSAVAGGPQRRRH